MNGSSSQAQDRPARELTGSGIGEGVPAGRCGEGNFAGQANAQTQPAGGMAEKRSEMKLPCLQEMGDIAPAIAILLRLQADYSRRDPSVSRAMVDVAYNAVATEIERYIRSAAKWFR